MCYDELNNDEEEPSDSDLTSSDGDVEQDSRTTAAAALDGPSLAADDDFASAVARAAELAGLTVVGSTVTDCTNGIHCLLVWRFVTSISSSASCV